MLTTDQVLAGFAKAGIDTPEKLDAHLAPAPDHEALKAIDARLAEIKTAEEAALAPLRDEKVELTNQRKSLVEKLRIA